MCELSYIVLLTEPQGMIDLDNVRNYTTDHPAWSVFGNAQEFQSLPETHQARIFFLNRTATKYLFSFTNPAANLFTGDSSNPFAKGNFRSVEECDDLANFPETNNRLKKWLYKRGISFDTWVFVLFEHYDHALLLTWKMFIKYAADILFVGDVMVFDKTLSWALFYFHENQLFFGKEAQYDPRQNEQMMQALNERKKRYPQFKHPYL
jgi:hypothetical protein